LTRHSGHSGQSGPTPRSSVNNELPMPPEEHAELITAGWPVEVVNSLRARGFRPVKPAATDLRSGDATALTMGFLRQGLLPHLHITVERTGNAEDLLRDIDTAIDAAAYRAGHAALAALFTRFTDAVKSPIARLPAPDLTALEARV
jgi:hypothetical protein